MLSFDPIRDPQLVMKDFVAEVHRKKKNYYKCNRGPRPSAALLLLDNGRHCWGSVEPTEGSPSCLQHGCETEWWANSVHDAEEGRIDPHCIRNIHAEVDAILACAKYGQSTNHAIMYSINKPCYACTKAIVKAGISKIYYAWAAYDEERTQRILINAGVEAIQLQIEEPVWQDS